MLGQELVRKGAPNRGGVYPPYGDTRHFGHGQLVTVGNYVWGSATCPPSWTRCGSSQEVRDPRKTCSARTFDAPDTTGSLRTT
jgi:hypothetical protein